MPTERVTYVDPDTHNHADVDIPEDLFNDDEIQWVRDAHGPSDLQARWRRFLGQAGARAMVDNEIQRRRILQTQPTPFAGGQAYDNYQMIRVETVLPNGSTRRADLTKVQFELGPRDELGNYDDNFQQLPDVTKMQQWEAYLASNVVKPDIPIYGSILTDLLDRLDTDTSEPAKRSCECLRAIPGFRTWPKAKILGVFALGGLAVGIWQLVEYLQSQAAGTTPTPPAAATDVTATAAWRTGAASAVTVNWTKAMVVAGVPAPTSWLVSLVSADGTKTERIVDGSLTSAMFMNVADGDYRVKVVARTADASSAEATTSVSVADTGSVNPPSGVPPVPTDVTLVLSTTPMGNFVTASWKPGTGAADNDTYSVTLSAVPPSTAPEITVAAGTMTSRMISPSTDGTYVVKVKAERGNQPSAEVTSGQVTYTRAGTPPNPPVAVKISAYRNATGQPGLVVRWDPPAGTPPRGYTVTFQPPGGAKATVVATGSTITGFPNLTDGAYSASVVANSATASSTAVTVSVTLAASSVPADTIDWDNVLSGKAIEDWKAVSTTMDSTQEVQFWTDVIAALTDSAKNYGGTASFAEQRALAQFLAAAITAPADAANTPAQLASLAGRLATEGQVPANRFPQTKGSTWSGDPLVLWHRASTIRRQDTRAFLPTRRRLQAIAVALNNYLAG